MTARSRTVVILLIAAAAAWLRTQNLFEPWVGSHNGWGGAMYGNIARNFLKYGYAGTRLGPVANFGTASEDQFEFYYHHPPLLVWLVSIAFRLFGVHEWSARLVPLGFSFASLALVFVFARRLYSERVALLALAFASVMPVENYYGSHLDPYGSVAVFFCLLAVYGYNRWRRERRAADLVLCNVAVLLGCMASWYAYFLVPLLLAHDRLFAPPTGPAERRGTPLLWTTAACALAAFALFIVHRSVLSGAGNPEVAGSLLEKLTARTSYSRIGFRGARLSPGAFLILHSRDLMRLISPPLVGLVAAWLVLFARDTIRRRLESRDGIVAVLLGYGALHTMAFPSAVSGHDYLVACYAPGAALAAALVVTRSHAHLARMRGSRAAMRAAAAVVAIVLFGGVMLTQRCYWWDLGTIEATRSAREWGATVRRETNATDMIFVPEEYDLVRSYYADRRLVFGVDTIEDLERSSPIRGGRAIFVCPPSAVDRLAVLRSALAARSAPRFAGGLEFYDIVP